MQQPVGFQDDGFLVRPKGLKNHLCHQVQFPVANHADVAVAVNVQAVFLPEGLAAVVHLIVALVAVDGIAALVGAPLVFAEGGPQFPQPYILGGPLAVGAFTLVDYHFCGAALTNFLTALEDFLGDDGFKVTLYI